MGTCTKKRNAICAGDSKWEVGVAEPCIWKRSTPTGCIQTPQPKNVLKLPAPANRIITITIIIIITFTMFLCPHQGLTTINMH
eukprot:10051751-Karenia_brevis.AAC.1